VLDFTSDTLLTRHRLIGDSPLSAGIDTGITSQERRWDRYIRRGPEQVVQRAQKGG